MPMIIRTNFIKNDEIFPENPYLISKKKDFEFLTFPEKDWKV